MKNLTNLTIGKASLALSSGDITCEDLATQSLDRVAERDGDLKAWTQVDRNLVLDAAKNRDSQPRKSPLHGIPFAAKDIVDTHKLPTSYGCAAYSGHQPNDDADIIKILEQAGAVMLGKTVTTEFAYYAPGATRNARNLEHTPGGSSSGSAAAVADNHVPFALGTQTAGSMIRPAAFNGIVGLKPSHGTLPTTGVHALAPSLDTLGFFTRSIPDQRLLLTATAPHLDIRNASDNPTIGICRTPWWQQADPEMQSAFEDYTSKLKDAGFNCISYGLPALFEDLADAQFTLMALEASRSLKTDFENHPEMLKAETVGLIEKGLDVTVSEEVWARNLTSQARYRLKSIFRRFDALITPPTRGAAPRGIENTGDPIFNRAWTLLGLPSITYPIATAKNGLPLGIQVVGAFGDDHALIDLADKMNIV